MEIHIEIRCKGTGFPTAEELRLRHEIEDRIQESGIGRVVDAGAGRGVMDIVVEPRDDQAQSGIERLILDSGLSQVASVRVLE